MSLNYRICDLNVRMNTYGRTAVQAIPYVFEFEESEDIYVHSEAFRVKVSDKGIDEDLYEYLASGFDFYKKLLNFDGFMLHSSAVVVDNRAYLFSADSGTGKSTHTALWLELFGEKAYILNDDKPALRLVEGTWYAYGTPWSGKYDISVNKCVPLGGIALIERAENNEIYPFSGPEAIRQIFTQSNRPRAMEWRIKLMELLDKLMTEVPIWKLKCNMDSSAAIMSYEAMSGKKYKKKENV